MGKKRKHKIRQLTPKEGFEDDFISMEEDSFEIFKKAVESTDWKQIAQEKETPVEEAIKKKKSKKTTELVQTLDLHGHTLERAKEAIAILIANALQGNAEKLTLTLITGKGRNSADGKPILAKEIPEYVKRKWKNRIIFCEESPADLSIDGVLV